ncbi:hypothetical protein L0244_13970 [bacterium]|nr:hypothetical protein [bacterium]
MFNMNDETFWLNVTNIALGVVTLACVVLFVGVVLQEVVERVRKHVPVFSPKDDHAFVLPELGLTMADGGERLDKDDASRQNGKAKPPTNEPKNSPSENY